MRILTLSLLIITAMVNCGIFDSDELTKPYHTAVFKNEILINGSDTISSPSSFEYDEGEPVSIHTMDEEADDSSIYGDFSISRKQLYYDIKISDTFSLGDTMIHKFTKYNYFKFFDSEKEIEQCPNFITCIPFNASKTPKVDYDKKELLAKKAFKFEYFLSDTGYYHTEIHIRKYQVWFKEWMMD